MVGKRNLIIFNQTCWRSLHDESVVKWQQWVEPICFTSVRLVLDILCYSYAARLLNNVAKGGTPNLGAYAGQLGRSNLSWVARKPEQRAGVGGLRRDMTKCQPFYIYRIVKPAWAIVNPPLSLLQRRLGLIEGGVDNTLKNDRNG